jgi:hypothetical protein
LLSKESGLEELMKVKEFIHFGLTSQGHPHSSFYMKQADFRF